jgi:hypothetical protein
MAKFDFAALGWLRGRLQALAHPDPTPLLVQWRRVIEEDNKRGVLAGQDKDGRPLAAVTYRPKGTPLRWGKRRQASHLAAGSVPEHNNLTSAQYRRLGGPPLAPRGVNSRVIQNLSTSHGYDSSKGVYYADGAWFDIVSRTGFPFLPVLLKPWPLDGLRPQGRQRCVAALQRWGRDLLKGLFG